MTFRLDRHLDRDPVPLWFQLKERLRTGIVEGALRPGDRIPTEQELIDLYGISRTPVRAALGALADEGLIVRTRGRGTFVRRSPIEQPVNRLDGFHADMTHKGIDPATRTLTVRVQSAGKEDRSILGLEGGSAVVIERLLLGDGRPVAFHRTRMPLWVLGGDRPWTPSELDGGSLYALMEQRSGSYPERAEETIGSVAADRARAGPLEVAIGTPLLHARRLSFDRSDRPVELVDIWYRADRYRYRVELRRP